MEEMKEIICYTHSLPEGDEQNITFMELLLDERWAEGDFECPEAIFSEIGSINNKLSAKQNYEFLLRAAKKYTLKAVGLPLPSSSSTKAPASNIPPLSPALSGNDNSETAAGLDGGYRTDCYIAGKYQQELLASGYFNTFIAALINNAKQLPNCGEAIAWLEQMISHAPAYYEIDDNTCPILIYRGSDTCYNTLNFFAEELAEALRTLDRKSVV